MRRRGTSLIESLVVCALLSLIFIGVFMIVDRGLRFYRLNDSVNDRQRETLAFLAKISSEVQNSSRATISIDPTPAGGCRGLSYGLPLDQEGKVHFDPGGNLKWQGWGCFYRNADKELRWVREYPATVSGVGPAPPLLQPSSLGTSSTGKIYVREVTGLHITEKFTDRDGKSVAKGFIEIVIESGKRDDPQGYWIQLQTSFAPRN